MTRLQRAISSDKWQDLRAVSAKDKVWDKHKADTEDVSEVAAIAGLSRPAQRMLNCSESLTFAWTSPDENGEVKLRLRDTHFCRFRHCPVCQWRRSLMWKARFHAALPDIVKTAPDGRWLFLTLTVRNCELSDLRATLSAIGKAWNRLQRHAIMSDVLGWIRTVEITRSADGTAHPHCHVLLLVSKRYFQPGHYRKTADWAASWAKAMRLDYTPMTDLRAVKDSGNGMPSAVAETLKYATKPSDLKASPDWFRGLVEATHRTRSISSGGVLKDALREDEETQGDLLAGDDQGDGSDDEAPSLRFNYAPDKRRYRRRLGPEAAGSGTDPALLILLFAVAHPVGPTGSRSEPIVGVGSAFLGLALWLFRL